MKKTTKKTKTTKTTAAATAAKSTKTKRITRTSKKKAVKAVSYTPVVKTSPVEDIPGWVKFVAILLILLGYTVYRFWGIAKVDGITISRLAYYQAMERQVGQATLDNLITEALIAREAEVQNYQVDQKAIDDQIATISAQIVAQGQTVEDALKAENITMEQVKRQFALQQIVNALGTGDVTPTDAEIDAYLAENKDSLPESLTTDELRSMAKSQLESQKGNENISAWLESLKSSATIIRY